MSEGIGEKSTEKNLPDADTRSLNPHFSSCALFKHLNNLFQKICVHIIKIAKLITVNINHANNVSIRIMKRQNNFAFAEWAASYMSRKFIYICNYNGFILQP